MQTKRQSIVEVLVNIAIGLSVAIPAQIAYFHLSGIEVQTIHNLGLAAWMTVVSFVRGYMIRRYFNV